MTTFLYRLMLVLLIPAFIGAMIVAGFIEAFLGVRCLFHQLWDEARDA